MQLMAESINYIDQESDLLVWLINSMKSCGPNVQISRALHDRCLELENNLIEQVAVVHTPVTTNSILRYMYKRGDGEPGEVSCGVFYLLMLGILGDSVEQYDEPVMPEIADAILLAIRTWAPTQDFLIVDGNCDVVHITSTPWATKRFGVMIDLMVEPTFPLPDPENDRYMAVFRDLTSI